tara:strand:- start:380 stop:724 length:345 start_codon:yes stop_codon:yes gene_type:complete
MAYTTTWSVTDLSSKQYGEFTNVTQVGVKCTVTEGSYKGEWTSRFYVGVADTTSSDYIEFSSVTEAKALEWAKAAMGSTAINDAETWGKMMIEEQKANSTKTSVGAVTNSVPWS